MIKNTKISGMLYLISQPLLLNLLSIPTTAYIIRELGAFHYGQWIIANIVANIAGSVGNLGFRSFFVKKIAQDPDNIAILLSDQIMLRLSITAITALSVIAIESQRNHDKTILICEIIVSISIIITSISSALGDALQGIEKFRDFSRTGLISGIILTALSVIAIKFHTGIIGLSIAYTSGPLMNLFMLYLIINKISIIRFSFSLKRLLDLVKESKEVNSQKIVSMIQDRTEQLITPVLISTNNFGIFSAATLPANRLSIIHEGISTVYYPTLSHNFKENIYLFQQNFIKLAHAMSIACIPPAIYCSFYAKDIAHILFNKEYELCKTIIQWTVWSIPIQGIWNAMGYGLLAAEKHILTSKAGIWISIISVALSFILIRNFGIIGTCYAWLIRSCIPPMVLGIIFNRSFPGIFKSFKALQLLVCNLFLLLGLIISTLIPIHASIISIMIGISLSLLLYATSLHYFKLINIIKAFSSLNNNKNHNQG